MTKGSEYRLAKPLAVTAGNSQPAEPIAAEESNYKLIPRPQQKVQDIPRTRTWVNTANTRAHSALTDEGATLNRLRTP